MPKRALLLFFLSTLLVYQASAGECDNWQTSHPEWLWCDGFEDGGSLEDRYDDSAVAPGGFDISNDDAFSGRYVLRQHYETGQVNAGWISWFYDNALGQQYGDSYDEIYVRWYHKFEDSFQGMPPKMARVRSLGPGWDKRFAVHCWIEDDSSNREIVADVYAPFSSQANSAGWLPVARSSFYYGDPSNIGRWVCLEMYVKKNTPGQTDGAYGFWADNELIVERTNVDLVGSTNYEFNEVMLDSYWNGGSPKEQNRYYDNFVISTQRIGCVGSQAQQCADGTPYGQCSANKPKYCDNGNLVDNCQQCGCPAGQSCQSDGSCSGQQGIPGDVTGDGKVDIFDLVLVAQNFGKKEGDCGAELWED
jgi:hypothetical protein